MSGPQVGSSSSRRSASIVSPSQAWGVLSRHAREEIAPLRLPELCRDSDRVSALVAVHNSSSESEGENNNGNHFLIVDMSRQLLTESTLNHLLSLASAMELPRFIRRVTWAPNNPDQPVKPASSSQEEDHSHKVDPTKMNNERSKIYATFSNDVMDSLHTENAPSTNTSMHMALRVPEGKGYAIYDASTGKNVLEIIHAEWHRIERFSDAVRLGRHTGATGHMIRDVLVIGRGVAVTALQFIYDALCRDEAAVMASRLGLSSTKNDSVAPTGTGVGRMRVLGQIAEALNPPSNPTISSAVVGRRIKILQSQDPIEVTSVLSELDPSTTLVISFTVSEIDEMAFATPLVRQWLRQKLAKSSNDGGKAIDTLMAKHMFLVTGHESYATSSANCSPDSTYVLPNHARCPPFTTCTAATLLPLSIVFGWSICLEFLAGAHDIDMHFASVNPRHNIPVLLALTEIWNERLLNATSRALVPFSNAWRSFPAFVMALEAKISRGSSSELTSNLSFGLNGVFGSGVHNDDSFQFDRMFHSEFIVAMDCQTGFHMGRSPFRLEDFHAAQDAIFCSCFAHADELAFGPTITENDTDGDISPRSQENSPLNSEGNRPSTIILCSKMDAFTCGQFVAFTEHRAAVKAYILGQDPFLVHEDLGGSSSSLKRRTEMLFDKLKRFDFLPSEGIDDTVVNDDSPSTFLSTDTLLGHYASLMRNERMYIVDDKQPTK
jgi:glucose-6-phosphate isomerase